MHLSLMNTIEILIFIVSYFFTEQEYCTAAHFADLYLIAVK